MTYTKGIPSEPGLYWYRETLESEPNIIKIMEDHSAHSFHTYYPPYHPYLDSVYFTPAIAPEPDDKE